jgi:DNA polymerase I
MSNVLKEKKEKDKKSTKGGKKELLVLLDAHAIIHRAYHALPQFATSSGEPTGALYGISSMLIRIIKDLNPDYIVACYDLPEKTFRHEAYEAYKGGRKKA